MTMKRVLMMLLVAAAPTLAAQRGDSTQGPPGDVEGLRRQIEERFHQRVREQLGLTNDQDTRLRSTQERFRARRQDLMARNRGIEDALDDQMRPGVAANADSVRKLMDARQALNGDRVRMEQEEDREMAGYLSPVQRAQFQRMRENFMRRVQQLRNERRQRGLGPRGPGGRPGGRRPPR
jgi:Spy/CpxP family protein refolding chaperone